MTTNICKNDIKCAVFDLDGTLLNTIKTITHYLNFALANNGLGEVTPEECRGFVGNGVRMLLIRAIEARGEYTDELYARMYESYNEAYNAEPHYLTEAYEGIPEMLEGLRARGIRLAVLSNKPHIATVGTIAKFFPNTFDVVSGGREGIPLKPDPTALLSTVSALGFTPDECLYVGDSDVDMETARNAGVALGLGVSWGFRDREVLKSAGADLIIDAPSELFRLFTKKT